MFTGEELSLGNEGANILGHLMHFNAYGHMQSTYPERFMVCKAKIRVISFLLTNQLIEQSRKSPKLHR